LEKDEEVDDLINIRVLNEPELIWCLGERFRKNKIYTFIGHTLLAMNPFKDLEHIYNESVIKNYQELAFSKKNIREKSPHIYSISALAFRQIYQNDVKK
jgi:myosin heavy subunit